MSLVNVATLLVNGLALAVSLGFLVIIVWHDFSRVLNRFFALFLGLVLLWNTGSLLALAVSLIDPHSNLIAAAVRVMEVGFTGSSIGIYVITTLLSGVHSRHFGWVAFVSLGLSLCYQVFLIVNNTPTTFRLSTEASIEYRFDTLTALFYIIFNATTLYILWRYHRKFRSPGLFIGLNLFVLGQSIGLLNPTLGAMPTATVTCAVATLIISFGILRNNIITPLAERINQLEAIHNVSLAIISKIDIEIVLKQIAIQASAWLQADAAGIFMVTGNNIELVTIYNLPEDYLHTRLQLGEGIAGKVAQTRRSILIENYARDWKGSHDFPSATITFGSYVAVPLLYGNAVTGVLIVIASKQGRLLNREDVQSLEMLSSQAAVAIAHSQLFQQRENLTLQIEAAHNQLQTVLTSTDSPVIATDRQLNIIFANPAAANILPLKEFTEHPIHLLQTLGILDKKWHTTIRNLKKQRTLSRETTIRGQTYICHITQFGTPQNTAGWVAVFNNITQIKELDRLKSEMVRMTSHDLKNPLQAAMANLELLAEDLGGTADEEMLASITAINLQLNRMNRIISGILDLERARSGPLNQVLTKPMQLILHAIEELQHLIKEHKMSINIDCPPDLPLCSVDPDQFERALINLLENAIKFSGNSHTIDIKAELDKDHIIFQVRDQGIGIPDTLQKHIFERFMRGAQLGQEGAAHISGSGLGLNLVKTIVDNHGGKIWFQSKVGEGTTFFISLPGIAHPQNEISEPAADRKAL